MSTGCEFYADALVARARGDLEPERVEGVEAHVASCDECRATLAVLRRVRGVPAPMPAGLEGRIQAAVRGVEPGESRAPEAGSPASRAGSGRARWGGWRSWALPIAAAAGVALWIGASALLAPGPAAGPGDDAALVEYEPYGTWPGSSPVVAGELVLSELSVEELEALLEEMR